MKVESRQAEQLEGKTLTTYLKSVNPGHALFSGVLYQGEYSSSLSSVKSLKKNFYLLSRVGLHLWGDKESAEEKSATEHLLKIKGATLFLDSEEGKGEKDVVIGGVLSRVGCFFILEKQDGQKMLLLAHSERKARMWVDHINQYLVGPST